MPRDQASLMIFNIIYALFVVCIYHFKKKIMTRELKVFGYLLDINLVSSIVELFCGLTIIWFGISGILTIIINKLYIILLSMINLLIMLYILVVSFNEEENNKYFIKAEYISLVLFII